MNICNFKRLYLQRHPGKVLLFFLLFPIYGFGSLSLIELLQRAPDNLDNGLKVAATYGETDDKLDVRSPEGQKKLEESGLNNLVRSVVVLARKKTSYRRDTPVEENLGMKLCPGESLKFKNEKVDTDVSCSGVLVGEKTILTAGHCVDDCKDLNVIFDYTTQNTDFNRSKIFGCNKMVVKPYLENFQDSSVDDYAIIELDRVPKGRSPVPVRPLMRDSQIRRLSPPSTSDRLVMVGSPLGLPLKLSYSEEGAGVFNFGSVLTANLDIFPGNSGSPVFSYKNGTPLLEGIAVAADRSFVYSEYLQRGKPIPCLKQVIYPAGEERFGVEIRGVGDIKGLSSPPLPLKKPTKPPLPPKKPTNSVQ